MLLSTLLGFSSGGKPCNPSSFITNTGSVDNCGVNAGQKDNMLVNRSKAKSAESEPLSRYNSLGTGQSRYSCKLHNVIIKMFTSHNIPLGLVLTVLWIGLPIVFILLGDNMKGTFKFCSP